jgi:hypothetical protein
MAETDRIAARLAAERRSVSGAGRHKRHGRLT